MISKYLGVILAAGKGSRMHPFSEDFPKPLLPICNQPLIEYHIRMMRQAGIHEIIILIGHHGAKIVNHLGDGKRFGVRIKYVEQKNMLGIAHAVGMLEEHISRPFLLFLGDIFFVTRNLRLMFQEFESQKLNAVLATKIEEDKEAIRRNFAIVESQDGLVERVIEKPRYIMNHLKGCGLYLFDLHIFDAIRRTPRTAMRDEYELTDSIQILINDRFRVKKCNMILEDVNLTNPSDLWRVNLAQLHRRRLPQWIGRHAVVPDKKKIVRSVIGDNVVIEKKIRIQDCVIFSDTVVKQKAAMKNSIVLFNKIISCA